MSVETPARESLRDRVFHSYPIGCTTVLSVFHLKLATAFQVKFAAFENLIRLAVDSRFLNSLKATSIFTIVSVALEFGIGLGLAVAADQLVRGRGVVRSIFLAPWTLPTAVIAGLWSWIFNDQYGALNALLQQARRGRLL